MKRTALRAFTPFLVTLTLISIAWAQSSPSIFTRPGVDFSQVRRVTVLPFEAGPGIQDPFAATKAYVFMVSALKGRGQAIIEIGDLFKRIQEDTGKNFTEMPRDDGLKLFVAEAPKYVDGFCLGTVSVWGTLTQTSQGAIRVPVYGWVSGAGGVWNWQTTQWVPVQTTQEVTVIGGTVALVQIVEGTPALLWQYSHIRMDRGGLFSRPPTPDKLAERFFQDVAKAVPTKP